MTNPEKTLLALLLSASIAACDNYTNETEEPVETEEPNEPADPEEPAEPEEPIEEENDFLTDSEGREFSYLPAGDLLPNSGPGHSDTTIYRPDIIFPLEDAAFLNSQVYRYGGSQGSVNGMEGGQCNAANYDYPWQDTFCESRSRSQIMCPDGGHEGVDIRAATCIPSSGETHWAVAAENGRIVGLDGSKYTVKLQTEDGTLYRYMHLDMSQLAVVDGESVVKGQRIGKVWNDFFNSSGESVPTTYHLHFEMYQNYAPDEETDPVFDQVSPYMTLVNAYERKLRGE
ncbi:M23 family metallopeptidase [Hyphococcus flavus]|uniref:M23 family metallopeptidase n=1 Tax=Hyphococcus flavus TaxID=1866326 RepID=A0AAF0CH18_9PROT|nr:M23 family metallopeptidase [Hyphococcus flavus]WDI33104.1 M23 family metallopeptidase [Hyphococcus flavus]